MIKKHENDVNHYDPHECVAELTAWHKTKSKYFVIGDSIEEHRRPLLWKEEFSTHSDDVGEFLAASP